jgi:hypothetical protein
MTETFNTALIKLIPKKGDCTQIKNWRPISLLSCFYKVVSKVVNARLDKVIDKVTSMAQKAYNSKRYIHESIINTVDVIRHCEVNGVSGVILSIDQKKAFDSVLHGYIKEVYRFFGFGQNFIRFMETIGTNRTARIMFDTGISDPIDLERGFDQGNSPSPRKYNIGEQILLFRLEYDPNIAGVYNSFLIPRQLAGNGADLAEVQTAERKGLVVDRELVHTNRKTNAFADDTAAGLLRNANNLNYVKQVLFDFGSVSGLETNVEKTTLMPIGNLGEPLEQDIIDLGFAMCTEMKILGITVNNTGTNLESNFECITTKVRNLATKWSRFTLSLPGRIAISKTMLISQIGYGACIISPRPEQINALQNIVDNYVTNGIVIAKDRLYTKPKKGGLGLINIENYVRGIQCSWMKRCLVNVNDVWRWQLVKTCNFNLDLVRLESIDKALHPITHNIVRSITKFQRSYWQKNENFLTAPLVDNMFFLRAAPERRAPVRGCVDRNLLGGILYNQHKETLLSLRMNTLVERNRVVPLDRLRQITGINFSENVYMYLSTAGRFAIKKYGGNPSSNGTCLTMSAFMSRIKKGSNKYRRIIEEFNIATPDVTKLRVVTTFFGLGNCEIPESPEIELLLGLWNLGSMNIRIRTFAFQFFNNSVSGGARTAARYRNAAIDQRCVFCVKSGLPNPAREDFYHLFIEC